MTTSHPEISLQTLGRAGDFGALAHYADPAYYTRSYRSRRHDVEYYARRAREIGGPVLEYGCGNGRITVALAKAAGSVVGVDLSAPMLADFQARLSSGPPSLRQRIELVKGDMRDVRLDRTFPLVVAPFNTFLHLYEIDDVRLFLASVRQHLARDGVFLFDVSIPQPADLCRSPNRKYPAPRFRHPESKQWIRYSERFEYDPLRQLLLVWMEFVPEDGSPAWVIPLTHRQFFPCELRALLEAAGFQSIVFTEDFSDQAPTVHVDSLVVECRISAESATGLEAGRDRT